LSVKQAKYLLLPVSLRAMVEIRIAEAHATTMKNNFMIGTSIIILTLRFSGGPRSGPSAATGG
jgi:hypothetical protein